MFLSTKKLRLQVLPKPSEAAPKGCGLLCALQRLQLGATRPAHVVHTVS